MYRYTIPAVPPSNNEYIGRDNRWKYQEIKKQWALLVAAYCRPRPPAPLEHASVTLVYCFGDNRRRDYCENCTKQEDCYWLKAIPPEGGSEAVL